MRRILRNVLIIAILIAGCILLTGCASNNTDEVVSEETKMERFQLQEATNLLMVMML